MSSCFFLRLTPDPPDPLGLACWPTCPASMFEDPDDMVDNEGEEALACLDEIMLGLTSSWPSNKRELF